MDLIKLIDGHLNAMGNILNDIQESAARSTGCGEGVLKMRERQRKLVRWRGAERRVGRGLKEKRPLMMMTMMGPKKIQKENL